MSDLGGNVKITSGTRVNQMNIRGVGSGANAGFEQSVATFADGEYCPRSLSTNDALFQWTLGANNSSTNIPNSCR
jgi:hypothetical protein